MPMVCAGVALCKSTIAADIVTTAHSVSFIMLIGDLSPIGIEHRCDCSAVRVDKPYVSAGLSQQQTLSPAT